MADRTEPPFDRCPSCGLPQIADAHSLVLYFPSADAARQFAAAMKELMPGTFRAYDVDGEAVHDDP